MAAALAKDDGGTTPLHKAFEERNFSLMDVLLSDMNINENPTNAIGISHFHIACTRNNVDIVKNFLANGVSVNACVSIDPTIEYKSYWDEIDWRGCSPLHFAVAFNQPKIVQLLLDNKADVKIQDARGFTALHLACRSMHEKFEEFMMTSLLKLPDAGVVGPKNRTRSNAFFNVEKAMGSLLIKDIYKSKQKVFNWTTNRDDHINIVKMLLQRKSDVNCHDKFGNTPIFYAYIFYAMDDSIFHGKYEEAARDNFLWEMYTRRKLILKMLLQHSPNLDTCWKNGSILHFMLEEAQMTENISGYAEMEIMEMFLRKKPTVDVLNEKKLTPLFIAVQKTARTDFIQLFLKHRANVNFYEPEEHSTLLHVALENIYDREQIIFDTVLRCGADPNAKQTDGTTVLHYLAGEYQYYPQICESLIAAGADVNAVDEKGQTPLFRACLFWNDGLAKMLLNHGADINIEDKEGKTVLCVVYDTFMDPENSCSRDNEMMQELSSVLLSHVAKNKSAVSEKVVASADKIRNLTSRNWMEVDIDDY